MLFPIEILSLGHLFENVILCIKFIPVNFLYSIIMSLKITEECINCDVCEPVCPNQAITQGEFIYEIAPQRCTECVGHFDMPQCQEVCPVACIILDETHAESREQLMEKYRQLTEEVLT